MPVDSYGRPVNIGDRVDLIDEDGKKIAVGVLNERGMIDLDGDATDAMREEEVAAIAKRAAAIPQKLIDLLEEYEFEMFNQRWSDDEKERAVKLWDAIVAADKTIGKEG